MLLRTHLSVISFLVLFVAVHFGASWLFVVAAFVATVIPDLDSARSKFGKKFWILRPVQWLAGHRKVFHSLIFALLVVFPIWFLSQNFALGFLLGYGVHLFTDSLTIQGVMLLYPFSEKKVRGFISTGGFVEGAIFVASIFVFALLCFNYYF